MLVTFLQSNLEGANLIELHLEDEFIGGRLHLLGVLLDQIALHGFDDSSAEGKCQRASLVVTFVATNYQVFAILSPLVFTRLKESGWMPLWGSVNCARSGRLSL